MKMRPAAAVMAHPRRRMAVGCHRPRAQRGTSCCAVTGASSAALRGGKMFRLLAFFPRTLFQALTKCLQVTRSPSPLTTTQPQEVQRPACSVHIHKITKLPAYTITTCMSPSHQQRRQPQTTSTRSPKYLACTVNSPPTHSLAL